MGSAGARGSSNEISRSSVDEEKAETGFDAVGSVLAVEVAALKVDATG